jgi:hypothetical protein
MVLFLSALLDYTVAERLAQVAVRGSGLVAKAKPASKGGIGEVIGSRGRSTLVLRELKTLESRFHGEKAPETGTLLPSKLPNRIPRRKMSRHRTKNRHTTRFCLYRPRNPAGAG